ncbi:Putative sigma-70 factor, ECF subfamily [Bradyrhizobium sp. ORS 278]|uniref:RNA polymerase sigma factor n=1 Tax=Bradyrhizobium sp. (strain ORS 278) TaxID=114615 RepID=UPI0001507CC0|nr:RNA polymerase sigma factor [Bradyrhizobium sp. ORS 278]CAL76064.1 Putative sigma-70 factor, ECF subfamily [Bradyrhizobium sp. ORS 278]
MAIDNIRTLRDLMLANYSVIDQQLTRRLGSADLASEVLQETYLKIESMHSTDEIKSPKAYLFRIALNIANDHRRAQARRLTTEEVDVLLDIPDDRPSPEREIEERSDIALLRRALADLPERRRQVLMLSRIEGLPHREIAQRMGVTVRTVESDLKQAVEHCADRLKRPTVKFGFAVRRTSNLQRRVVRDGSIGPSVSPRALDRDQKNRSIAPQDSPGATSHRMDIATEVRGSDAGRRGGAARVARAKPGA